MKNLKSLTTWRLIVWAVLYISVFFYFSCGGDEEVEVAPTVQEAATFTVDATSREAWTYFSLAKGGVVEVADPANSMNWDLGFQRTTVKLNGGVSGPGKGRAIMLADVGFNEVKEAPASGYAADSEANLAIVAQSEKGWYIYTGPPSHWILPLENRVFVVQAADGTYAKLQFVGFYKDNASKTDGGYITFEYLHQPDGSRQF
ncbi:MAG: HmuY family protein [Candidatus Poribacteria bacterium]|nr:HmuY family protein [Candidatus Poribacteria bacterium]MDE0505062.1 HmuY family protein [Candidatus Poribacteria bacterium]